MILMDLMLPMKSGEEVLRSLREVKKTPVIVLSAKSDVHNRIELLRLGADDFICKPFDIDEVILRLEAVLRRVEDKNEKKDPVSNISAHCNGSRCSDKCDNAQCDSQTPDDPVLFHFPEPPFALLDELTIAKADPP